VYFKIFYFSSSQDRGQLEQRRQGAYGGQQRDPGVFRVRKSSAHSQLEEGGRAAHQHRQDQQLFRSVGILNRINIFDHFDLNRK
jgi:hypothetical protein